MSLKKWFGSGATEIHCPLCGSAESRPTGGFTRYSQLRQALAGVPEWLEAHASGAGIPDIPAEVRQLVGDPEMPALDEGADPEHRRCAKCKTLLPPQFWRGGPASSLAMTVAGTAGHGKTTWLMSVLTPPRRSRYSIIGFNEHHSVQPYNYVEPYTIDMLDREFRTAIPFLLMGCTISYADMLIDVRTLDVKGETFQTDLPEVSRRVERHLTARRGGGAMLIVERFTANEADRAATIAQTYLRLSHGIRTRQKRGDVLWKAVVWTFLDQAQWRPEGETWLRGAVREVAPFLRLAADIPRYDTPGLEELYDQLRADDDLALRQLLVGVRDASLDAPAIEALAALLFRLQLLYSAYVARRRVNRLEYFYAGDGRQYVRICQELAKQLYLQWDAPIGGVGTMLTGGNADEDWQVIPCGRMADTTGPPESVWNDQIVIEAVARVGAR
ncbi:MAG: hypothetical protein ABI779_13835 [Acidobacteriota bacterium]